MYFGINAIENIKKIIEEIVGIFWNVLIFRHLKMTMGLNLFKIPSF